MSQARPPNQALNRRDKASGATNFGDNSSWRQKNPSAANTVEQLPGAKIGSAYVEKYRGSPAVETGISTATSPRLSGRLARLSVFNGI